MHKETPRRPAHSSVIDSLNEGDGQSRNTIAEVENDSEVKNRLLGYW